MSTIISLNCPACEHYLEIDGERIGTIVACAQCRTQFRIPQPQASPRIAPPPPPPPPAAKKGWVRCRLCGARRTGEARCEFCGFDFRSTDQIQRDETSRVRRELGLRVGGALGAILLLIALPAWAVHFKRTTEHDLGVCRENLQIFHQALRTCEGGPAGMPKATGREFVIAIAERERVPHAILCPAVDRDSTLRGMDFRGPARPWNELGPDDVVAADYEGNHRGITVLLKDGRIDYAPKDSELYQRALAQTKD